MVRSNRETEPGSARPNPTSLLQFGPWTLECCIEVVYVYAVSGGGLKNCAHCYYYYYYYCHLIFFNPFFSFFLSWGLKTQPNHWTNKQMVIT